MTELEKRVKEYLDYLEIEKNRSPKTRENYGRYLSVFLAFAKIKIPREITAELVRDFRLRLARHSVNGETLKKNTQAYYVIALRNFLKYLIKRDEKNVLSPDKIELPKTPSRQIDAVEYSELERILAAPQGNNPRVLRDRAILETLFSTGLRLSELCALNRYLDLERGEISVRGKGDKLRVVFLSDSAKRTIKEYLGKRGDAEEALFISLTKSNRKVGEPPKAIGRITPRAVQRLVDFYARKAGIGRRVHPHSFRHSFATDLLINGADLRSVQELLGHSNVNTTQIYTHLTNKELREIHRAFHGKRRN
ncbi:MAG: site-specific tyrosine recombinase/integron integrase [Patescibacteria group bacterium]